MAKLNGSPPEPKFHLATSRVESYVRDNLLANFNRKTQDYLLHHFESMKYGFKNDPQGAIPISWSYLRKHFRRMVDLKELGVLQEKVMDKKEKLTPETAGTCGTVKTGKFVNDRYYWSG